MRAVRAAQLLDRGFSGTSLSWLQPSQGTVDQLVPVDASPPNLRDEMCGGKHHHPASDEDEDTVASTTNGSLTGGVATFSLSGLQAPTLKPSEMLAAAPAPSEPIVVYTGPTRTGAALVAAVAADADRDAPATRHRGKKSRLAARKPDATTETKADSAQADTKSKPIKHASVKPDAAAAPKTGDKPAKPKTAVKPKAGSGDSKPAPKSTSGEPKPAG
jgi:D-alanyl-D-alanine carboxypeptidase